MRAATGGRGVDIVVETAGSTLPQALSALAFGGFVGIVGFLGGFETRLLLVPLIKKMIRIQGIAVGPRDQFEAMTRAIVAHDIKGRVESGVKFIKSSFVPLREFHSLEHANEQLRAWILEEAGNRIHGTTRERPLALFTQTEQAMLQPLPAIAPECPVWAKAKLHGNCHVQFEYCYYSAPFQLIGQELWLEIAPSAVRIYHGHELVAIHPRLFKSGTKSTVQDHLPVDAVAFLMRDPQWCLRNVSMRLRHRS